MKKSNKKNIYKFAVTPERDKELKIIAAALPNLQRLNSKGEPMFHERSKHIPWSELSAEEKIKYPQEEFWPQRKGENFQRPKLFIKRWGVPALDDHYTLLYWKYREFGNEGVAQYVDRVNEITEAAKKAAQTIRPADEVKQPDPEPAEVNGEI